MVYTLYIVQKVSHLTYVFSLVLVIVRAIRGSSTFCARRNHLVICVECFVVIIGSDNGRGVMRKSSKPDKSHLAAHAFSDRTGHGGMLAGGIRCGVWNPDRMVYINCYLRRRKIRILIA